MPQFYFKLHFIACKPMTIMIKLKILFCRIHVHAILFCSYLSSNTISNIGSGAFQGLSSMAVLFVDIAIIIYLFRACGKICTLISDNNISAT